MEGLCGYEGKGLCEDDFLDKGEGGGCGTATPYHIGQAQEEEEINNYASIDYLQ